MQHNKVPPNNKDVGMNVNLDNSHYPKAEFAEAMGVDPIIPSLIRQIVRLSTVSELVTLIWIDTISLIMLMREILSIHKFINAEFLESHGLNWYRDWGATHHITLSSDLKNLTVHSKYQDRISRSGHLSISSMVEVWLSVMLSIPYWILLTLLFSCIMCCMFPLSLKTNYQLTIYKIQWCLYRVSPYFLFFFLKGWHMGTSSYEEHTKAFCNCLS